MNEGLAPAGTYSTTSFKPTVVLTLPTDGWRFFFTDDNDELALGMGIVELAGGRVANVVDPATHESVPAPDDLVAWLGARPLLQSGAPEAVTVGGIDGQYIDVTNKGSVDVDVFFYPTGNLRVSSGATARFFVLPFDGPDLVFTGFAMSERFDEAMGILQPVIDSIVIAPG
jgi:hypothetical protein